MFLTDTSFRFNMSRKFMNGCKSRSNGLIVTLNVSPNALNGFHKTFKRITNRLQMDDKRFYPFNR